MHTWRTAASDCPTKGEYTSAAVSTMKLAVAALAAALRKGKERGKGVSEGTSVGGNKWQTLDTIAPLFATQAHTNTHT